MELMAQYHEPEGGHKKWDIEWIKRNNMVDGEMYEVSEVRMGQSHTTIELVGKDGAFNSIWFEFFEKGKPIDIYRDSRYNPYLPSGFVGYCHDCGEPLTKQNQFADHTHIWECKKCGYLNAKNDMM